MDACVHDRVYFSISYSFIMLVLQNIDIACIYDKLKFEKQYYYHLLKLMFVRLIRLNNSYIVQPIVILKDI